jgi:hypothetical protein
MTLRRLFALLCTIATIAAAPAVSITGQLLAYQQGYVFFTSGNGFRVAPDVRIVDDKTKQPSSMLPRPRLFARAVFNDAGQVAELDLSKTELPLAPLTPLVQSYVVAASSPYPNPELAPKTAGTNALTATTTAGMHFSGKPVLVQITVEVPPTTPLNAQIYIATDTTGWNPQAIQMDRIDALHFRITRRFASGTIIHYVYTRGSLQSEERAANGLDEPARTLLITDADVRAENDHVYQWADQNVASGTNIQPDVAPTPFNPAPFPNLPRGIATPPAH